MTGEAKPAAAVAASVPAGGAAPVTALTAATSDAAPGALRPALIPLGGTAAVCDGDTCVIP